MYMINVLCVMKGLYRTSLVTTKKYSILRSFQLSKSLKITKITEYKLKIILVKQNHSVFIKK